LVSPVDSNCFVRTIMAVVEVIGDHVADQDVLLNAPEAAS
jgi:hypothetical protein